MNILGEKEVDRGDKHKFWLRANGIWSSVLCCRDRDVQIEINMNTLHLHQIGANWLDEFEIDISLDFGETFNFEWTKLHRPT